jgi:hypothetical protein
MKEFKQESFENARREKALFPVDIPGGGEGIQEFLGQDGPRSLLRRIDDV